jgi:DNA-binding HxlR family transcriptional regulator
MNEKIKNQVIEHLSKNGNSAFGDLVQNINAPYEDVLETVLAMRQKGIIEKKQDPPGYYSLNTVFGIQ